MYAPERKLARIYVSAVGEHLGGPGKLKRRAAEVETAPLFAGELVQVVLNFGIGIKQNPGGSGAAEVLQDKRTVLEGDVHQAIPAEDHVGSRQGVASEVSDTKLATLSAEAPFVALDHPRHDVHAVIISDRKVNVPHPVPVPAGGVKYRLSTKTRKQVRQAPADVVRGAQLGSGPGAGLATIPCIGLVDLRKQRLPRLQPPAQVMQSAEASDRGLQPLDSRRAEAGGIAQHRAKPGVRCGHLVGACSSARPEGWPDRPAGQHCRDAVLNTAAVYRHQLGNRIDGMADRCRVVGGAHHE